MQKLKGKNDGMLGKVPAHFDLREYEHARKDKN